MTNIQLQQILQKGIKQLKLKLPKATQQKLIDYVLLLHKWNKTYNLTAICTPEEIMTRHILDSLAIVPYIHGQRILDVGTGAGLPGIVLALALPKKQFVLLDSNNKKIRFLIHAVSVLKIKNVEIVQERVEKYFPEQKFDSIITRAFSSLQNILHKTKHLYNPGGYLLAMKGKYPAQELQEIDKSVIVHKIQVPGLDAERNLVCLKL
jgi:16S rRNA (guanine527-N7)-methyltransferase